MKKKTKEIAKKSNDKTEGAIAVFALLLILLFSMMNQGLISFIIAISFIVLLAIYKFLKK